MAVDMENNLGRQAWGQVAVINKEFCQSCCHDFYQLPETKKNNERTLHLSYKGKLLEKKTSEWNFNIDNNLSTILKTTNLFIPWIMKLKCRKSRN